MPIVIVPNHVRDAINAALDRELALVPDAAKDREEMYSQLLAHYNEHGTIPDFSIAKNEPPKTKVAWFTFGQIHVHIVNGFRFDKDTVAEIHDDDPRGKMFDIFGPKWSMEYDKKPDMSYYPKGILKIVVVPGNPPTLKVGR